MKATLTRIGLSMFMLETPGGARLVTDPWIDHNPAVPAAWRDPERFDELDALVLSHGHYDHTAGVSALAAACPSAEILAPWELAWHLRDKALASVVALNVGGQWRVKDTVITYVPASHSSSYGKQRAYAGPACGVVFEIDNGPCIYYAGDSGMSAEMSVIGAYYKPDLAILPVGGTITMDPRQAVFAATALLQVRHVVPCHDLPSPDDAPNAQLLASALEADASLASFVGRGVEFRELMRGHSDVRVTVLAPGDSMEVDDVAELAPHGRKATLA